MSKLIKSNYCNKLRDSLYWWLGRKKPFIVNDEYKIELLHIDRQHYSAKIRVTNLKSNEVTTIDGIGVSNDDK